MKIRRILSRKGHEVVTIAPDRTVHDAMRTLVEHDIGSVVVLDGDAVRGILTERDMLRLGAGDPARLADTLVSEAMTTDVITCSPDDDIEAAMSVMTRNRVRHLPVVEDGSLRGLVSIGDAVKASLTEVEEENRQLKKYIHGQTR